MDLENRLDDQHRPRGLNPNQTYRHRLLYGEVIEHGWEHFDLHILAVVRHHTALFLEANPGTLTTEQVDILVVLDRYELTIAEQAYMDTIQPSLNIAPFANASFPNLGGTGLARDLDFKTIVSLAHQGREVLETTIERHRLNQTGKKLSESTRSKMSANNMGVQVAVKDEDTGSVIIYSTKSKASSVLGISIRTITR